MNCSFYLALPSLLFLFIGASWAQGQKIPPDADFQTYQTQLQAFPIPKGGVIDATKMNRSFAEFLVAAKAATTSQPLYMSNKVEAYFYVHPNVLGPLIEDTGIILFSDDGVSLFMKEVTPDNDQFAPDTKPVFAHYGMGQHLPDLDGNRDKHNSTSFHVTSVVMKKGKKYRLALAYSNISHGKPQDIDGFTIYFYKVDPVDLDVNTNMDANIDAKDDALELAEERPVIIDVNNDDDPPDGIDNMNDKIDGNVDKAELGDTGVRKGAPFGKLIVRVNPDRLMEGDQLELLNKKSAEVSKMKRAGQGSLEYAKDAAGKTMPANVRDGIIRVFDPAGKALLEPGTTEAKIPTPNGSDPTDPRYKSTPIAAPYLMEGISYGTTILSLRVLDKTGQPRRLSTVDKTGRLTAGPEDNAVEDSVRVAVNVDRYGDGSMEAVPLVAKVGQHKASTPMYAHLIQQSGNPAYTAIQAHVTLATHPKLTWLPNGRSPRLYTRANFWIGLDGNKS